jgi:hypothetical protein
LGKVFEKIIANELLNFFDNNNLINIEQFGFRRSCSTVHQIKRIINHIRDGFNKKISTGLILMDVEKAFDSVWHNGLLHKLRNAGIGIHLLKIVQSFLHKRSFLVNVETETSDILPIQAGVPQGSTLSPLLYIFYVSDMPKSTHCQIAQFADDTAIYTTARLSKTVCNRIRTGIKKNFDYFKLWKININKDKTSAVYFTRNRKPNKVPSSEITLDNSTRTGWRNNCKYLGVILDKKLNFSDHISNACSRTLKPIPIYYSLINRKSKLNLKNKLLLYKTVFRPTLTYAAPIWGGAAKTHLKKVQTVQNKVLKLIINKPYWTRTELVHTESNIDLIKDFIGKINRRFTDKLSFSDNILVRELF